MSTLTRISMETNQIKPPEQHKMQVEGIRKSKFNRKGGRGTTGSRPGRALRVMGSEAAPWPLPRNSQYGLWLSLGLRRSAVPLLTVTRADLVSLPWLLSSRMQLLPLKAAPGRTNGADVGWGPSTVSGVESVLKSCQPLRLPQLLHFRSLLDLDLAQSRCQCPTHLPTPLSSAKGGNTSCPVQEA